MHSRFEGSRTLVATTPAGEAHVHVAEGFGIRFLGLMRVPAGEIEPLLFPRCRSLHMYWMKTPIDVVWLDLTLDGEGGTAEALDVIAELPRRKAASAPSGLDSEVRKRVAALELPPGDAARLGVKPGTSLDFRIENASRG